MDLHPIRYELWRRRARRYASLRLLRELVEWERERIRCGIAKVQAGDGKSTAGVTTGQTVSYGSNTTPGNLLIVAVTTTSSNSLTVTVVDSNVTYSQAGSYQTNSADRASLWYTPNCAGGADTVTVTPSANTKVGIAIFEFSGAATSSPLDQTHGAGSTTSSLTTGTVPVNNANELVIAVFCMGTGSQLAGFTATGNITSLGFSNLAGSNAGIATTYNVSQSAGVAATASITGSAPYSGIGASFKPANLPPQRPAMSLTEDLAPLLDPGGIFAQGALWQSQVPPRVVVPQLISVAGGWEEHPLWET